MTTTGLQSWPLNRNRKEALQLSVLLGIGRHGEEYMERFHGRHPWVSPQSTKDTPTPTRFCSITSLFHSHSSTADRTAAPLLTLLPNSSPAALLWVQRRPLTDCQSASSRGQIGDSTPTAATVQHQTGARKKNILPAVGRLEECT